MRRASFRWLHPTRFRLPLRGTWSCTQGTGGALSHKGPFRHAFDFEVKDEEGRLHQGEGASLKDYYCYRLPVLAAAAGTVVRVESSVPDNESGTLNLEQGFGNHVALQHAPGLFSTVAHLARGSVKVAEGQTVRQGELLGLCGNSGRSARPHVHFQLQGGSHPQGGTLPCRFTDAVVRDATERVAADLCPQEGQAVRNLEHDVERAEFFNFPYRARFRFRQGGGKASLELESDLDATGQLLLRACGRPGRLYYSLSEGFFTTYDSPEATPEGLRILRAALSRVPLDASDSLRWTDYLPARPFRSGLLRVLSDLVSPFLYRDGIEMEYEMRRDGAALIVMGQSRSRDRAGKPILSTRAELLRGTGPRCAEMTLRGQRFTLTREVAAGGDA